MLFREQTAKVMTALAFLLFLSACAQQSAGPRVVDPVFATSNIRTLALFPVVFVADEPDPFCHADMGDTLRLQVQIVLEKKGYKVVRVNKPGGNDNRWPTTKLEPDVGILRKAVPEGADAMALVWINEYNDSDLCDADSQSLSIKATAALYRVAKGKELWRNWAAAADLSMGRRMASSPADVVPPQLAQKLMATLSWAP